MPRYMVVAAPRRGPLRGTIAQRAGMAVGVFLGVQLGSLTFDGHFLTFPSSFSSQGGAAGPAQAAAVPAARGGGGNLLTGHLAGLPASTPDVSPWSVFREGGGTQVAVAWAKILLRQLGLPPGGPRLQFIWDWEVNEGGGGRYNPLNQGPVPGRPELTNTGQQFGGGAAGYVSWAAGIAGADDFLHMPNYAGVLAGLRKGSYAEARDALWASPWSGIHYGWGANWHSSPVPGT